jgi:hypothetical protein
MNRLWILSIASLLCCALPIRAGQAGDVVVGVNFWYTPPNMSAEDMVKQLAASGVPIIRTSLFPGNADFIIKAYQHGIGTVAIVYPHTNSTAKKKRAWADVPLSQLKPQEFTDGFKPMLDKLEGAGVRLAAIELGNEINTSGYNGDIASPGSGRVLGIRDLNNPKDAEARPIAAGFQVYLRIMAALKDLRDHSTLNSATPILSGASGDWGLPGPKSFSKQLGVSVPDSIECLRQNGLDKLVDGYAVHVYPSGDPHRSVSMRVASLERYVFGACKQSTKPCWLTEWGFPNPSQSCPINDTTRTQVIEVQRSAFKQFAQQGRLAAIIYYTWSAPPTKLDPMAIFRCGALTDAGRLALKPM